MLTRQVLLSVGVLSYSVMHMLCRTTGSVIERQGHMHPTFASEADKKPLTAVGIKSWWLVLRPILFLCNKGGADSTWATLLITSSFSMTAKYWTPHPEGFDKVFWRDGLPRFVACALELPVVDDFVRSV